MGDDSRSLFSPLQMPKSADVQVPYIKWCGICT